MCIVPEAESYTKKLSAGSGAAAMDTLLPSSASMTAAGSSNARAILSRTPFMNSARANASPSEPLMLCIRALSMEMFMDISLPFISKGNATFTAWPSSRFERASR